MISKSPARRKPKKLFALTKENLAHMEKQYEKDKAAKNVVTNADKWSNANSSVANDIDQRILFEASNRTLVSRFPEKKTGKLFI